jgi:MFS family permease
MKDNPEKPGGSPSADSGGLTLVFALSYLSTGIAAQFGLVSQPLQYFMLKELNLTAAQISSYLAIMMLPWVLKPFYGLVCDFVPFLGYRRKSYLALANLTAGVAFVVMACAETLPIILGALLLSAAAVAASTAITVGLAVEDGKHERRARDHFSLQTACYYGALIVASLGGGWLCQVLTPYAALHTAALVAALPVLLVSVLVLVLVREEKSQLNAEGFLKSLSALKQAGRSRALWLVALFIWCWDFSPSFGVPLYVYESKTLGFSQAFIGQLAAWNALGMLIGSFAYRWLLKDRSMKVQLSLAVAMGVVSTFAYLLLSTPASAVVLEIGRGTANIIAILTMYSLAADVCPARAEVSVMAALIAVRNLATEAATFAGGLLFTHVFDNQLAPLIVVAGTTSALCAVLIPYLGDPEGGKRGAVE